MKSKAKAITLVPLSDIKLNPKNRNSHSPEQIERLAQIIKYQGFREPGVISNQTGFLAAGEGRYLACKLLKLKAMPVMYQDFDSLEQEIAFGISTNAIALWSELDLSSIENDLKEMGKDFDKDLLGIQEVALEIIEPSEKGEPKDNEFKPIECPNCGILIENN